MMQDVFAQIRQNARDYVPIAVIEDFIHRISQWEPQIKASFQQISQSDAATGLEFGAWLERGLLDLTASADGVVTTLIPIGSITSLRLKEEGGQVSLEVGTSGQVQLGYQASSDAARNELKSYFLRLQELLFRTSEAGPPALR